MRSLLSVILLLPCLASAGCSASRDPGPPSLSPGAARLIPDGPLSLGIRYGKTGVIGLRRVDPAGHPVAGAEVRFDTADAPGGGGSAQGGSTLSVPRAITDANGHVEVSIAAGTEEVSFGITASSAGTEDLHYYVSVSRFNFVTLAAQVAYTGEAMGTVARVQASVYQGATCDRLAPSRALPPPLPLGVKDADGSSAVLEFPDLLDRDHALLGRALDDKGRIVASGCVDLSAGQVLPGETVAVPVPLVLTSINLDGSFRLKLHAAFSATVGGGGTTPVSRYCSTSL